MYRFARMRSAQRAKLAGADAVKRSKSMTCYLLDGGMSREMAWVWAWAL